MFLPQIGKEKRKEEKRVKRKKRTNTNPENKNRGKEKENQSNLEREVEVKAILENWNSSISFSSFQTLSFPYGQNLLLVGVTR